MTSIEVLGLDRETVPETGGSILVKSSLIDVSLDENFRTQSWTEDLTGDVSTSYPLEVAFTGVGSATFTPSWTINASLGFCFSVRTSGTLEVGASTSTLASIAVRASADVYAQAALKRIAAGTYQINLEVKDLATNTSVYSASASVSGPGGEILLRYNGAQVVATHVGADGVRVNVARLHAAGGSSTVEIGSSQPNAGSGAVKIWGFRWFPTLTGYEATTWYNFIYPTRKERGQARFSVQPEILAAFEITLRGSGASHASQEVVGTLEIGEFDSIEEKPSFLISQIEQLYFEGGGIYACPLRGVPQDNRGDFIVANQCFNDGSALDENPVVIHTVQGGQLRQDFDPRQTPSFELEDVNGLRFGPGFDFHRVHHPDGTLGESTTKTVLDCRCLEFAGGSKRVYYGMIATPMTANQDVYIEVEPTWSVGQNASPGSTIDTFNFILYSEDDEIVYASGNLSRPDVDGDPTLLTHSASLAPGRYYLRIIAINNASTGAPGEDFDGLSVRGTIYEGTTDADPVIGEAYAAPVRTNTVPSFDAVDGGYGHFSVDIRRANIVAYVFDASSQTLDRFESPGTTWAATKTDSLACIRVDDGFVFFFDLGEEELEDQQKDHLYYVHLSDAGVWTAPAQFFLPSSVAGWVHAFDVVERGDIATFFVSWASGSDLYRISVPDRQGDLLYRERAYPFFPNGPESIEAWDVDLSSYAFDGSAIRIAPLDADRYTIEASHLQKVFTNNPDLYFRAVDGYRLSKKVVFFDSIRANYDADRDVTLLAGIDLHSRFGVVFAGSGRIFKEVAIPLHFSAYDEIHRVGYHIRLSAHIDHLDAALSPDGSIVTLAAAGDLYEVGLSDFSVFWDNNDYLIRYTSESLERFFEEDSYEFESRLAGSEIEIYPTRHRFRAMPFHGVGLESYNASRPRVGLTRSAHKMIASTQSMAHTHRPVVWINGVTDRVPFEVPHEQVWFPEMGDYHPAVTAVGDLTDDRLQISPALIYQNVEMSLTPTTSFRYKYDRLETGYRFHFRVKSLRAAYKVEPECYAEACMRVGEDPDNPGEVLRTSVEMRWFVTGETALAQYYDNASAAWVTVGTLTDFDGPIWDLYCQGRMLGGDDLRAEVLFIAKRLENIQDIETGVHSLEDMNRDEFVFYEGVVIGDAAHADPETSFSVGYRGNDGSAHAEDFNIYQLSYCLLRADEGVYVETEKTKDGVTEFDYTPRILPGVDTRNFDDTILFDHQPNEPDYAFKLFKLNENSLTSRVHWYNGFSFAWTAGAGFVGDAWALQRTLVNSPETLMSKHLHGFWTSAGEGEEVVIWADATDSGRDKFQADLFLVKGVNVKRVEVVGRDSSLDAWTSLGWIDMARYQMPVYESVEREQVRFWNENFKLYPGRFAEHAHYLKEDGLVGPVARVKSSHDTHLIVDLATVDAGAEWTEPLELFASRGFLRFDALQEYTQLGFRIQPQKTYQGWFEVHTVDFGHARDLPFGELADGGSGEVYSLPSEQYYAVDNQAFATTRNAIVPSFTYSFGTASPELYLRLLSMVDQVSMGSRPVWVIPGGPRSQDSFALTLINNDVKHGILKDTSFERPNAERVYYLGLTLDGVGD